MERMGVIYKWTNKVNGKSYIGQTINEEGRKKDHINGRYKCYFHDAIKKYGLENFDYEVLEQIEESKLSEREIYWIKYFDTYNNGYNLTEGGEGTRGFSYKLTDEQKKKISESHKGLIPWNKGKHGIYSEETLKKIAARDHSLCWTDELRKKQSEKLKGKPSPNKGKVTSKETKKKISESVKKTFKENNISEKLSKILKGKPSWNKGIKTGPRPDHSKTMKNKVHMNNGEISKMIDKELVEEYQNNGWVLGRIMKNKKNK